MYSICISFAFLNINGLGNSMLKVTLSVFMCLMQPEWTGCTYNHIISGMFCYALVFFSFS